jgi:hypothetical protein
MTIHSRVNHIAGNQSSDWFRYQCAHCNSEVSGAIVAAYETTQWLLCPKCGCGSVSVHGNLIPNTSFGPLIEGLPNNVESAYQEARRCMSVNAYTACELICRKILMHVAADKGGKRRGNFCCLSQSFRKFGIHHTTYERVGRFNQNSRE